VDADGTVYVRTADGERAVGQIPGATEAEALAFYVNRYDALAGQVSLLVTRIKGGALSPEQAKARVKVLKEAVAHASAVGDLAALEAELETLTPIIEELSASRKAEREQAVAESKEAKERLAAQAEELAEGNDWRNGADRFRALLEEWKALPRIDRATDDELWRRFSTARTTYTRRRKTHFAELSVVRDEAKRKKEQILAEARELATSIEWGKASAGFRELMERWKAAGSAQREVDDKLWAEFRAIQDGFFSAKQAVFSAQDAEYSANLEKRLALLDEAEKKILPVEDLEVAKQAFRAFLDEYSAVGRVPRDQIRALDARVKALESAVRNAEDAEWKRTDPQAKSRAEDTVAMLSKEIDKLREKLEKASAKGDEKAAAKAEESIKTYETWLEQAQKTLADFSR
jgi:hypothetical protein